MDVWVWVWVCANVPYSISFKPNDWNDSAILSIFVCVSIESKWDVYKILYIEPQTKDQQCQTYLCHSWWLLLLFVHITNPSKIVAQIEKWEDITKCQQMWWCNFYSIFFLYTKRKRMTKANSSKQTLRMWQTITITNHNNNTRNGAITHKHSYTLNKNQIWHTVCRLHVNHNW